MDALQWEVMQLELNLNMRDVVGNPKTDDFVDDNSRISFGHQLILILDELYESAKESCNGDCVNLNESSI
ncbi:hypothetical protein ACB098_11G053400 [Castanea mollissima]